MRLPTAAPPARTAAAVPRARCICIACVAWQLSTAAAARAAGNFSACAPAASVFACVARAAGNFSSWQCAGPGVLLYDLDWTLVNPDGTNVTERHCEYAEVDLQAGTFSW